MSCIGIDAVEVDEPLELLEQQNLAAVEALASLAQSWRQLLGEAQFNRVREAVENLEFSLGSKLLRAALRQSSTHVPGLGAAVNRSA